MGSSIGLGSFALPSLAGGAQVSRPDREHDRLITIFLNGGMDALGVVVPHGEQGRLVAARPTLHVPAPGQAGGSYDLDGFFGLRPEAAPLLAPFGAGDLLFLHATGLGHSTRSHFAAIERMASGDPLAPPGRTGWVARLLDARRASRPGELRALTLGESRPHEHAGLGPALALPSAANLRFPGAPHRALARRAAFQRMFDRTDSELRDAADVALGALDQLSAVDFAGYVPANGAQYPQSTTGRALREVATLMKSGSTIESFHVHSQGWDLHSQPDPTDPNLRALVADLSASLAAFHADLRASTVGYTVVVQSEFGRRVAENASFGTDHGHGGAMMVMGARVAGGRVEADWPGLGPGDLDQGDLAITIDHRDVLAEIAQRRLGARDLIGLFPGHVPRFRGVVS